MMKRWIACLLLVMLFTTASAAPMPVLSRAIRLIGTEESGHDYGCAETDTNGQSSLGFLQWNAGRAANLLKKIIAKDEMQAVAILGEGMAAQLKAAKACRLAPAELEQVSRLLKSPAGVAVQDEQARIDVSGYIDRAISLGIRDDNALCYYADIAHQVGSGAVKKYHVLAADMAGGYPLVTLDHLYQAALTFATHTKARRTRVYNRLKQNPITSVPRPTAISLTSGPIALKVGDQVALAFQLTPADAQTKTSWASRDKRIAQVKDGVVTALAPGQTAIRVSTDNGLSDTVSVTVTARPVESVKIQGESRMRAGETQTLIALVTPGGAQARWKSANPKVARVNQRGEVTARKKGVATIVVNAGGKIARFKIRVSASSPA